MIVNVKFENENVKIIGTMAKNNIIYKVTAYVVDDGVMNILFNKADAITGVKNRLNQARLTYSNPKIEKRIMNLIDFYKN